MGWAVFQGGTIATRPYRLSFDGLAAASDGLLKLCGEVYIHIHIRLALAVSEPIGCVAGDGD